MARTHCNMEVIMNTTKQQERANHRLELAKLINTKTDEANICGKLTALYQVLNDVQARIKELESKLPKDFWKSNA